MAENNLTCADLEGRLRAAAAAQRQGNASEADRLCRSVLQEDPNNATAQMLLGIGLMNRGEAEAAVVLFAEITARDPQNADALIWLANGYRAAGRLADAITAAQQAATVAPDSPHVGYCLGFALCAANRFSDALPWLKASAERQVNNPQTHYRLGLCYLGLGETDQAIESLERAARLAPSVPGIRIALGNAHLANRQLGRAKNAGEEALKLDPRSAPAHCLLASLYTGLGEINEAKIHLTAAIELDPNSGEAHTLLGSALLASGEFEGARRNLETALQLDPNQTWAYYSLAQIDRPKSGDDPLIRDAELLLQAKTLPPKSEAQLHYALGKRYQDLAEWHTSMDHYDEANRLMSMADAEARNWDPATMGSEADKMISSVGAAFFESFHGSASTSVEPIFIVGMIRSGTSLTEQILSCHPQVKGAGELHFWLERASLVLDQGPRIAPECAHQYCELLRSKAPGFRQVTDKAPGNFAVLGVIHACLPNAKIIHIRRNPLDTCLSIWTTPMADAPRFSFNRSNIVAAYRHYLRYMDHWRRVLPASTLFEIDYEALVAEPETVTRSMLSFCELPWDDACLRPEDNRRAVLTPSLWRVRQPIDRSSVEKWRRFEPWLREFRDLV